MNSKSHSNAIPKWIMIYGWLMAAATIGFGLVFYLDSDPTISGDPNWYVGGRNLAIAAVLLLGLFRRDVKLLFAGMLLRFVVDLGDMAGAFIAGDTVSGLVFIPFFTIPQALACWTLWKQFASDEPTLLLDSQSTTSASR